MKKNNEIRFSTQTEFKKKLDLIVVESLGLNYQQGYHALMSFGLEIFLNNLSNKSLTLKIQHIPNERTQKLSFDSNNVQNTRNKGGNS